MNWRKLLAGLILFMGGCMPGQLRAGVFYDLSTHTSSATMKVSGDIKVAASTSTKDTAVITLEGSTGKISATSSVAGLLGYFNNTSYSGLSGGIYVLSNEGIAVRGYSTSGYAGYFTSAYSTGTALAVSSGKVGIGDITPEYTLDVVGGGYFSSTVTASAFYGDGSNLTGLEADFSGVRYSTDPVSTSLVDLSTVTTQLNLKLTSGTIPTNFIDLSTVTTALAGKLSNTASISPALIDLSTVTTALGGKLSNTASISPSLVNLSTVTTALDGKTDLTETSSVTVTNLVQATGFTTAGQIYSSGTATNYFAGKVNIADDEFSVGTSTFNTTNGVVLIGTNTNTAGSGPLYIVGNQVILERTSASGPTGSGGYIAAMYSSSGQVTGDRLGYLLFGGQRPTLGKSNAAGIVSFAEEVWATGSAPAYLSFETISPASTSRTEKMRLTASGSVGISSTTPSEKLSVDGNVNITGSYLVNGVGVAGLGDVVTTATNTFTANNTFSNVTSTITFSGWVDVGVETVSGTCDSATPSLCRVACSAGKRIMSGGCSPAAAAYMYASFPSTENTSSTTAVGTPASSGQTAYSWSCGSTSGAGTINAICARIK